MKIRPVRSLMVLSLAVVALFLVRGGEVPRPLPPPMRADAAQWDPVNALALAEAANLAYASEGLTAAREALRCETVEPLVFPLTIPKKFHFEEGEPGPQAFVAAGPAQIVIAFRGTEVNVADMLTDAWAQPVELSARVPGRVHGGFATTCGALWPDLMLKVSAARKKFPAARLWLTGHSLGGGLANMAAAKLLFDEKLEVQGLLTFGTPVTGDETFHKALDKALGGRHWRCVHQLDLVTLDLSAVPMPDIPFLGSLPGVDGLKKATTFFRHGGSPIYINSDGTMAEEVTGALTREALTLGYHWVKSRSFSPPDDVLSRHSMGGGYVPALRKLVAGSAAKAK